VSFSQNDFNHSSIFSGRGSSLERCPDHLKKGCGCGQKGISVSSINSFGGGGVRTVPEPTTTKRKKPSTMGPTGGVFSFLGGTTAPRLVMFSWNFSFFCLRARVDCSESRLDERVHRPKSATKKEQHKTQSLERHKNRNDAWRAGGGRD
jgi:hypothetical protein